MPPQVGRAGDSGGSAVRQPPLPEDQKQDVSATKTKSASGETTADQSTETKDQQDQAKAKTAHGSKQHAIERKNERNIGEQVVKNNLHKSVPESGPGWDSIQKAGQILANLPEAAGAAAGSLAESGAVTIHNEKVLELTRRPYPQDKIPGKMYEMEDIKRGTHESVKTRPNTEQVATMNETRLNGVPVPGFPGIKFVDHPKQERTVTQQGLEQRIKDLNGGAVLTDFEKKLVSEWNEKGLKHEDKTLTPIKGASLNGNESEKEVQAYKVTTGGSGNRKTVVYDRNGNEIIGPRYSEAPLIDRGLGPFEYVGYAQIGKHVVTKVAGKMFAKKEIETVVKTEVGAGARTGAKAEAGATAKAETSAAKAEAGAAKAETGAGTNQASADMPQPDVSSPSIIGGGKVSIRTAKGPEEMPFTEYQRRVTEAKKWVEQESANVPRGQGLWRRKEELYEQAQEKFGLQQNWQAYKNEPNLVGQRVRDAANVEAEAAKKATGAAKTKPEAGPAKKPEGTRPADPPSATGAPRTDPGSPTIIGGGKVSIKTGKGAEEMQFTEYQRRWNEAKRWVDQESANVPRGQGLWKRKEELYEQAQERFGLQQNWQAYKNEPNLVGKRVRDVDYPSE